MRHSSVPRRAEYGLTTLFRRRRLAARCQAGSDRQRFPLETAGSQSTSDESRHPAPDESLPNGAQTGLTALLHNSRLLFVTLSLDVGGTERHIARVSVELARRGWPVGVFCFNQLGAFAGETRAAGVEVLGPPIPADLSRTSRPKRAALTALAATRLAVHLVRSRPQIAHFFLAEPYIAGAPVARALRIPHLVMSRRSLNIYQRNFPGLAKLERQLHPRMQAILGNSLSVVRELHREEAVPLERLGLIYNGVDITGLTPSSEPRRLRERLGLPPASFVIIALANLHSYKGHADLIEALAGIDAALPKPWSLLCVGRDEGQRSTLETLAAARGIGANVRFLGPRYDVADCLAASDLAVSPSHQEGFSNSVLESMALGLAVVATDVGGTPEAVLDGETGSIVPPHDPTRLGAAIRDLALDPDRRRRYGAAGARRIREVFSLSRSVDNYEALYRGLLAGRKPGEIPEIALPLAFQAEARSALATEAAAAPNLRSI